MLNDGPALSRFWSCLCFLLFAGIMGCGQGNFVGVSVGSTAKSAYYGTVSLSSSTVAFPDATVGSTSASISLQASNDDEIPSSALAFTTNGDFDLIANSCPQILQAKSSCLLSLAFAPSTTGKRSGTLLVAQANANTIVSLAGEGIATHHTLTLQMSSSYIRASDHQQIVALLDGTSSNELSWSMSTPDPAFGTVDRLGLYTAPPQPPSGGYAVVNAVYSLDPTVVADISIPVYMALPSLTALSPAALSSGAQTALLSGSSLARATRILLNGQPIDFLSNADGTITIKPVIAPWQTGSVSIIAEADGSQGGSSNTLAVPIKMRAATYDAAVRLAEQASFGATPARVESIQALGIPAWIEGQLKSKKFDYTDPTVRYSIAQWYRNTQVDTYSLRQRVALILQQQFVTSTKGNLCFEPGTCGPLWEDMLERDAFGNARTLLQDVVQSTIMGAYLDNVDNGAHPGGSPPNQNMGRELMQLMTIGTVQLGPDGVPITGPTGQTIPTYDQSNVVAMAAALSGWTNQQSIYPDLYDPLPAYTSVVPMILLESFHDQGSKPILPGVTLPPGQGGQSDMNASLDALFYHSNFGPFLCKRLIQGLVKSNPSPAYVRRVNSVFSHDGQGTRGNLTAVVRAILLDSEARQGDDPTFVDTSGGHLAEPLLYLSAVMNAVNGTFTDEQVQGVDSQLGQGLYNAPSIFGYYSPNHHLADGTPAPEGQLLDNVYAFNKMSATYELLNNTLGGFYLDWSRSPFWNAANSSDLLDLINHLLYHGQLSAQNRSVLSEYIGAQPSARLNDLLPNILFLAFTNTSYQVFR